MSFRTLNIEETHLFKKTVEKHLFARRFSEISFIETIPKIDLGGKMHSSTNRCGTRTFLLRKSCSNDNKNSV